QDPRRAAAYRDEGRVQQPAVAGLPQSVDPQGLWRGQVPPRLRLSPLPGISHGAPPPPSPPQFQLPELRAIAARPGLTHALARHKELPDIPLMQELLDDAKQKHVVEFLSSGAAIGRALLIHGAAPRERIAALRDAFDQVVKDPEFIRQADRTGLEIDPTPGL